MDRILLTVEQWLNPLIRRAVREAFAEVLEKHLDDKPKYGRLMTVDQLAKESGYSKHSIYQMNSNKQIPGAAKIGAKLMFETETALAWIKDGCPKKS